MSRVLVKRISCADDFKNPLYCYITIRQLMYSMGEGFEDCTGGWPNALNLLEWLLQKNYITEKQYMRIRPTIGKDKWGSPKDFLVGYGKFSLMENGESDFPAWTKGFQLLAEYISEHEDEREKHYQLICHHPWARTEEDNESDDDDYDDLPVGSLTYSGWWNKEHFNFRVEDIYQDDLDTDTMTKEEWLKDGGVNGTSYADEYNFLSKMSIGEADYYAKGDQHNKISISIIEKKLNFYRGDYELDIQYVICNSNVYKQIKENSIHFWPHKDEDEIKILQDAQNSNKFRFAICDDLDDDEIIFR